MEYVVLKDYQFVLLVSGVLFIFVLLIIVFLYGIKRKYDSIEKHISKKTDVTYAECINEYELLSKELGFEDNKSKMKKMFKIVELFKKKS